jgi:glycosyltransferase involved in cell wall biosynthesis
MKVLHVAQPVDGGVAGVVASLAADQQTRGWQPTVACPSQGVLPDVLRKTDIAVREWTATRSPGPRTAIESHSLSGIIRAVQPDAIHLHGSKAGLAGRLAVRGTLPTIFQPHLWSFQSEPGITTAPALAWERFAARWTDRFVCVSTDEELAGRRAGVKGDITVICNGVDVEEIRPRDRSEVRRQLGLADRPTAVCIARVAPLKGQDMLLEAWPDVLAQVPDAQLLLVGDGPLREQLQRDVPVSKHPSVRWIGWSNIPSDYMAAADVVVVPSRAEGMALVPLEAMAAGRSLVAFDAGGIRQSVGDGGAVLAVGDIHGLSEQIARRLLDPEFADNEGNRGRRRAELEFDQRFSANSIADLVVELTSSAR